MLQKIAKFFSKKKPFEGSKRIIKPAFEVGGVQYYEFDTTANLPFKRGLKFLSVYNELDMKCDRFYLNSLCDAIEAQFNKPRVGFTEMANIRTWIAQTKDRLTWVYQEDLVYKLASVVFFDENENPDDWEWGYALKKIEHWKKHSPVGDFFLQEPLQKLIPFLGESKLNILTYSQTQKEQDKAMLENLLQNLSGSQKIDLPDFTARYFSEEMKRSGV